MGVCAGRVFLAVLLLIFETTNDYVRFHGESLRPCSTTRVRLTFCHYHFVFVNARSLSIGSIDDSDHRPVVVHDPHRSLEVVAVSLTAHLARFLRSSQIEAKLIPSSARLSAASTSSAPPSSSSTPPTELSETRHRLRIRPRVEEREGC